jgi:hypothetical protein
MQRSKGEPGKFIDLKEVEKLLTRDTYGVQDLVDLGLFHTEHYAREAMKSGKLSHENIGKRCLVATRGDVLDYWKVHRNKPYEAANNTVTFKLTISEVDYLKGIVEHACHRLKRQFTRDTLLSNILNHLKGNGANCENQPHLFKL